MVQVWGRRSNQITNLSFQRLLPVSPSTPPELLRHEAPTPACDVYSYAMVLYEIIFRAEPFAKDVPEVGTPLSHATCHALDLSSLADYCGFHTQLEANPDSCHLSNWI